ncbi:hypothetical protein KDW_60550 [Dictyobacter vulcani]|uniref:Uncharacterized protein n=1 Tax=Dictyobacter vulcani TaxID=2607529 RepID=A0A5J4KWN6_9CHLR|nr:hypothetical protein [Dictyobacter vulcani]GER91893.1 hypothetical protein KDW_60550 [Dictyobacter vulcani]
MAWLLFWILIIFLLLFVPSMWAARARRAPRHEQLEKPTQPARIVAAPRPWQPEVLREHAPLLANQIRQAQVQGGLIRALSVVRPALVEALVQPQAQLLYALRARAITLYQQQESCSWLEAVEAIAYAGLSIETSGPGHADPLVIYFLLQANCREDAMAYFCLSTASSTEVAREVVQQIEQLIEDGNTDLLSEGKRDPDPQALRFLLTAGYILLAIRYYRDCTDVSMLEAREAIQRLQTQWGLT